MTYLCAAMVHVRHTAGPTRDHAPLRPRHPDKNQGNEDEAGEHFKKLFAAHQRMLRDTDGSDEEEEDFDEDDFEAAMEEALAFFAFMWAPDVMFLVRLPFGRCIGVHPMIEHATDRSSDITMASGHMPAAY
jgi:hypothetical protein